MLLLSWFMQQSLLYVGKRTTDNAVGIFGLICPSRTGRQIKDYYRLTGAAKRAMLKGSRGISVLPVASRSAMVAPTPGPS